MRRYSVCRQVAAGPFLSAGAGAGAEVEAGPGGRQILVDDPDGNPIELHEAPKA